MTVDRLEFEKSGDAYFPTDVFADLTLGIWINITDGGEYEVSQHLKRIGTYKTLDEAENFANEYYHKIIANCREQRHSLALAKKSLEEYINKG